MNAVLNAEELEEHPGNWRLNVEYDIVARKGLQDLKQVQAFQQLPSLNQQFEKVAPLTFGLGRKSVGLAVHIKQEADEGTAGSTGKSRDQKCFTLGKIFPPVMVEHSIV